jgi:hypothetical protein
MRLMTDKDSNDTGSDKVKQRPGHFEPGGKFAPIKNRFEYEKRMESLLPQERELVKELTNFADLCKYFEEHNRKLDGSFAEAVRQAAKLPLEERTVHIREINQRLMAALEDAGEGTQLRN